MIKIKALEILKEYYGYDSFRDGQNEIINSILNLNDTLAIMPTGGGKSLCYQIPALMFDGLSLVISPLISLMKDQVDVLKELGIPCAYINSSLSTKDLNLILKGILDKRFKIIYIAPERLESESFVNVISQVKLSFMAVDEAHCISQWGHDFRSSYLKIPAFISQLKHKPVSAAFTATATPEVRNDIIKKLDLDRNNEFISGFDRENLNFSVVKGENNLDFILKYLKKNSDKSGIIYASTRKQVDKIYENLKNKNYSVGRYHAGMNESERKKNQEEFIYDNLKLMVATNAFGMGIDKSNVSFVIHNNIPKDIESYYQEAGRAGRDGSNAECILIFNPKDILTQRYFIENNDREVSEELIEIKYQKLSAISNYCHTSMCLRKYILEYFGETEVNDKCDNCSNCLDNIKLIDMTDEAKKIISCVGRLKGAYGLNMIANVLFGSKNKKLLSCNLDQVSTYGLLSDYSSKAVKTMINQLVADEYLEITNGEYPLLVLRKKAYSFLKSNDKIYRKELEIRENKEVNDALLLKLKALRTRIAREENVPPYVVFTDKTLIEMARYIPINKDEMLKIKGVGALKFERYGKNFMELLINLSSSFQAVEKINTNNRLSKKVKSHLVSYDLYSSGKNLYEISQERELSIQTIFKHLMDSAMDGKNINFDDFFNKEEENLILEKVEKIGFQKLSPLKEILPTNITYIQIKAVVFKNYILN